MSESHFLPGFVDLQVNGYSGVDFSSPRLNRDDLVRAWREILAAGTAAFLPTLITSPLEVYRNNLALIAETMDREEFRGRVLGIHLEGPFISSVKGAVGAHNPAWTLPPDIPTFDAFLAWAKGRIRLLTLAAELEGADRLARHAVAQGVVVAIGHTLAGVEDLRRLSESGAKALTHLGNGLPAQLPIFANPLWAGLAAEGYTATMIADGHHIPPAILRAMIRAKGIEHTIIVSDAAPVAGLPPGEYVTLGNKAVLEPSGRLYNPEQGHLVGSSYTLLKCMNVLAGLTAQTGECSFSLAELAAMGLDNPLRLLGLGRQSLCQSPGVEFNETRQVFVVTP